MTGRRGWKFVIARSHAELDALDEDFWARASPKQRLEAALELSLQVYGSRGSMTTR